MTQNVILVDDQAFLRKGVKNYIENNSDFKVTFEASNFEECLELKNQIEENKNAKNELIAIVDISLKQKVQYVCTPPVHIYRNKLPKIIL